MTAVTARSGPADTQQLAAILKADNQPLEPIGLGSKRAVGRKVEAQPLYLSRLTGVVDYRPKELVLTARAGTGLSEIEQLLQENDQRFAFEPPSLASLLGSDVSGQSLGGVIAANLSGSRRLSAGAARDHLLGVTAVNGRGEVFRSGGQVVKNVTGYDLSKLLAGSWGTLAVLSEVTLKTVPRAETELTLLLPDQAIAVAVERMCQAMGSPHEVSSAAFDPWRGTALRLEGFAASVAAREASLLRDLGQPETERLEAEDSVAFWQQTGSAAAFADWPVVWRLSVPPTDASRVVAAIEPERYQLDWGGGLIWAAYDAVDAARVRGALRDGHATLIKAPADAKPCRQQPPPAALGPYIERIRDAFDPDRRLNPGRMD